MHSGFHYDGELRDKRPPVSKSSLPQIPSCNNDTEPHNSGRRSQPTMWRCLMQLSDESARQPPPPGHRNQQPTEQKCLNHDMITTNTLNKHTTGRNGVCVLMHSPVMAAICEGRGSHVIRTRIFFCQIPATLCTNCYRL